MGRMAEYAQDLDDGGSDDAEAWAYQQQTESRRWDDELANDPGYLEWVNSINYETTKEYERGYYCN